MVRNMQKFLAWFEMYDVYIGLGVCVIYQYINIAQVIELSSYNNSFVTMGNSSFSTRGVNIVRWPPRDWQKKYEIHAIP